MCCLRGVKCNVYSAISGCAVTSDPSRWWLRHRVSVWAEQLWFELSLM